MGEHDLQIGPVHERRQMGEQERKRRGAREGSRESQELNKWVESEESIWANGRFI